MQKHLQNRREKLLIWIVGIELEILELLRYLALVTSTAQVKDQPVLQEIEPETAYRGKKVRLTLLCAVVPYQDLPTPPDTSSKPPSNRPTNGTSNCGCQINICTILRNFWEWDEI